MGVHNLWKALSKGGAVQTYDGSQPGQHAGIIEAVENKVVAVDLSAWLMQAQTQPALLEHYDSDYARVVKVVFDRTIHWLRYGCLPVFVIEGRTPAAKLDKLRARCVAQYGPHASTAGNRAGSQFDRLGQAAKRLLDALGVPCVQAEGEGEAMCAALNVCGWVHAVQTADVDALLFGALTVYRQMHLQTDDPRRSTLTRCCMYDVRRVLGIERGGDAALMAVAHLAGGDYDVGGADNVGEVLALGAVRQLLADCQDDESVLQRLEAALAAGPDPELDALTKCTGCKACGHEGGRKGRINAHSARNGCAACGCEDGCVPRDWEQCGCAFHTRADERLLNRVVRRAAGTPGFMAGFRTAADAYAEQTRLAIAAVQREYGLPVAGSSRNVFSWRCRPDARAVAEVMCRYIKEWDYRQVRLKLLPLLLEWDVRQGPSAGPSVRPLLQFRPTSIRKVSSKGVGAGELTGVPTRQQQGWRYVLLVDRLPAGPQLSAAPAAPASPAAAAAAGGSSSSSSDAAEDLAIDQTWIAGTARSRPPKQQAPAGGSSSPWPAVMHSQAQSLQSPQQQQQRGLTAAGLTADTAVDLVSGDDDDTYEAKPVLATQMPFRSPGGAGSQQQLPRSPGMLVSQGGGSQAAAASGGGGGSLQFAEHRSVRCSLIDTVWPHLSQAFRRPAASGGRARSAGGRKKAAAGTAAAATGDDKQRTVKDFFAVAKDYTAPGRQPTKLPSASEGGSIPGLAGLLGGSGISSGSRRGTTQVVAAAGFASPPPPAAAAAAAAAGVGAGSRTHAGGTPAAHQQRPEPQQSFMQWVSQEQPDRQQPRAQQQQPAQNPQQQQQQQQQLSKAAAAAAGRSRPLSGKAAGAAAAGGGGSGGGSGGSSRSRKKAAPKTPCKAGPLDRFLRPAAAATGGTAAGDGSSHAARLLLLLQLDEGMQLHSPPDDIPSLAARLAAKQTAAAAGGPSHTPSPRSSRQRPCSDEPGDGDAQAVAAAAGGGDGWQLMPPPAKKPSTPQAKELLASPVKALTPPAGCGGAGGAGGAGGYSLQYAALLEQMGVATPPDDSEQQHRQQQAPASSVKKGLFTATAPQRPPPHAPSIQQAPPECIELLDSPMDAGGAGGGAAAGALPGRRGSIEVVDLT